MKAPSKHFSFVFLFSTFFLVIIINLHAQSLQGNLLIDSLQKDLSKQTDDTSKIKTLYRLSSAVSENDSASALKYANACMKLSKQINWQKGIGLAYLAYARAYNVISEFTASLKNTDTAYEIFKSINSKKDMAATLKISGLDYESLSSYPKCMEVNLTALRLYEDINDKKGIQAICNNIGGVYYDMSDLNKALEYYNKSLVMSKQLNDADGIADAVGNIANVYTDEGRYDSAYKYNLSAIELYRQLNDSFELCLTYYNLGNLFLKQYNAKSAYEFYNHCIAVADKIGATQQAAASYGEIGELYLNTARDSSSKYILSPVFKTGKISSLQKAKYYLANALELSKKTGDVYLLMYNSNLASETEEALGNYKAALSYHKNYTLYKDSIFNDENKKKITALETQRLTEVKDKEIQLLNREKALQASEVKRQTLIRNIIIASVIITALLSFIFIRAYNRRKKTAFNKQVSEVEMKALRAQMNPHFIFNSLHSINKYILENDKENASAYLSKFANLMRLILENSREQEVPLEKDLKALELYMQLEALRFKNKFNYSIETDKAINKENTLIPPMLLQPFVENTILHGFDKTENGTIKISVHKEVDMMKCVVEDNGSGRQNISANDDENKKRKSLGLKIINERLSIINQLKKAKAVINIFDLKDSENKPSGLRIELLLPLEAAF